MGRPRLHNHDLPLRLYNEAQGYRYRISVKGERADFLLGRDRGAAIAVADRLNSMKRAERMAAASDARNLYGEIRKRIFIRDGYACVYCGSKERLGIDHVIPHVHGGSSAPFNVVTACLDCNHLKGDGDPREFLAAMAGAIHRVIDAAVSQGTRIDQAAANDAAPN